MHRKNCTQSDGQFERLLNGLKQRHQMNGKPSRNRASAKMAQTAIEALLAKSISNDPQLLKNHNLHVKRQAVRKQYNVAGNNIECPSHVYHASLGSSSQFLLSHLLTQEFRRTDSVLELGVGSGAVLLGLAGKFNLAECHGTDISTASINAFSSNAKSNDISVSQSISDLFDALPPKRYDVIVFNPPLLDIRGKTAEEDMMLCDEGGALLQRFVQQLPQWLAPDGKAYVVVSNLGNPYPLLKSKLNYSFIGAEVFIADYVLVRAVAKICAQ